MKGKFVWAGRPNQHAGHVRSPELVATRGLSSLPYLTLRNQICGDVIETLFQRVEWIAGAGVLLDDEPFAAGFFRGGDD